MPIGMLENVANAAKNFGLTYDHAMWGYTRDEASLIEILEADLHVLEDAIKAYHKARAS